MPSSLPRWARLLDFACLLILLIAALVAVSGGFRLRVGGVRVALTSPVRLLAWTAAIALLRHYLVREPPAHRYLASVLARVNTAPVRVAALAALATRLPIFLVGYIAIFAFGYATGARPPVRFFDSELLNMPVRHDAGWYLQIAIYGYEYLGEAASTVQQNLAFFPAFPLLMRWLAMLGGNTWLSYVVSGTLISCVAFVAALVYVYVLARERLTDEQSRAALWLLAAYPFALFYGALYTESLFLLAAVGAFYHTSQRDWWRAAGWACLAGITRPNGFLLGVPLAIVAVTPWLPRRLVGGPALQTEPSDARVDRDARSALGPGLLVAASAGVGALMYSAYVWSVTGDALMWLKLHAAWGRTYTGLWFLVAARYNFIAEQGWQAYMTTLHHDLLNGLGALFVLAAAWPVARRLGLAYGAFILINMLPPLASGELLSAGRFSSVQFPAFVWLAAVVSPQSRPAWVAAFAALQALNAAMFYTWRQLF